MTYELSCWKKMEETHLSWLYNGYKIWNYYFNLFQVITQTKNGRHRFFFVSGHWKIFVPHVVLNPFQKADDMMKPTKISSNIPLGIHLLTWTPDFLDKKSAVHPELLKWHMQESIPRVPGGLTPSEESWPRKPTAKKKRRTNTKNNSRKNQGLR